jgi:hypothetical protein
MALGARIMFDWTMAMRELLQRLPFSTVALLNLTCS